MGAAAAAAATATALPLHATTVATKTPAVTAMAGVETIINNQLKAVASNGNRNGDNDSNKDDNYYEGKGGSGSNLAAAWRRQRRQRRQRQQRGVRNGGSSGSLLAAGAAWG